MTPQNTSNLPSVWPIHTVVIFDCDSTLSTIEGIDELARMSGHEHDVAAMTKRAMEGDLPLEAVYGHRLGAANPTQEEVRAIAKIYRETVVAGAREVIEALQTLGVLVFIVSGGLIEPVRDFGVWLGVPRERIFAVGMEYDQLAGKWWRYWDQPNGKNMRANYLAHEAHPLSGTSGKIKVIREIRRQFPGRALLVGDGGSDLEAADEVDLFIGFGGIAYRDRVAEQSPIYIRTHTLTPILPLSLGISGNTPRFTRIWADGLSHILDGSVSFMDPELAKSFWDSVRRI